jgi:uncharacterized protein (DUF1697 family)
MAVAMLRAVNVAGHQKISMEALRALFVSLGLKNVQTYIQSGNIVFREPRQTSTKLASQIENALEAEFGIRPAVILRSTTEMNEVIENNPFAGRDEILPNRLLVVFLSNSPVQKAMDQVRALRCEPEEMHIVGRELYIHYPNGMARPKMPLARIERMLQCSSTGRNWNTVNKLTEMSEAAEK